jgi:chaperone required for assembly of F1-ATPase
MILFQHQQPGGNDERLSTGAPSLTKIDEDYQNHQWGAEESGNLEAHQESIRCRRARTPESCVKHE